MNLRDAQMQNLAATPCLLCGQALADAGENTLFDTRFGLDEPYAIVACPVCGLEHTVPAPGAEQLKTLYETYYNFAGVTGPAYTSLRERFQTSPAYRLWLALDGDISFQTVQGRGRLLDVGCNEGRGLRAYRANGFAAEGLELNENAAATARRAGFTVHTQTVEAYQPQALYDVVVLSNVLEHALSPREMLRHIHGMLGPGGRLWISCPNSRSWLRSLLGPFWINWHVPFHIVHFSAGTLRRMLEESGFAVRSIRQETPALWVAQSLIARLFARRGRPTRQLRSAKLVAPMILAIRGLLFPFLWLGNRAGRGDCLVVFAEKT